MLQTSTSKKRLIASMLICLLIIVLLYALMCTASGVDPASYKYQSYLLQAQAWLRGEVALDGDYPYLELAVYEGRYYVSFPPVPAIPMVLYTLLFGDDVPGGLFQKIYVAAACLLILSELLRERRMPWSHCIAWAIFACFASAMLPITLVGGVWYEAQTLAFLFCAGAVIAIRRSHPTIACLLYALAVGCRPFSVCLGPVLLALYLQNHRSSGVPAILRSLAPGILTGLAIAACYGAYNYIRFGNPFEFGHNYLPEFTRSAHGQLSLVYVKDNLRTLFLGSPFSICNECPSGACISFNQFGFSMFVSCPILACSVVWLVQDILCHRMTAVKWTALAMALVNILLLLMHRTLGGHQFGARYALELVPLSLACLLEQDRRSIACWEAVLMSLGLVFNLIGGILVHV